MPRRATLAVLVAAIVPAVFANCNTGLPGLIDNSALEGLYSITRGAVKVTVAYSASGGGEVQEDSQTSELAPLDPADYPELLGPLVDQWNAGLDDLNAKLDAALPEQVVITFPQAATMRLTDPNDASKTADGLFVNDQYVFVGDLSGECGGSDQGAGGVLTAGTIDGTIVRADRTSTGKIARTLLVALFGPNENGLVFTVQISVDFTAERIGDAPASQPTT